MANKNLMMKEAPDVPSRQSLEQALRDAGNAHHEFEQLVLKGERDELWHGFYAAYVLGRFGDFAAPSSLSEWLINAPAGEDWPALAADHVLSELPG